MSDPFRSNANSQLIREAQVGLTAVAIVLSLFLYVAYYKISGRGRQLPEHVRNAPIANHVWNGEPPVFQSEKSTQTRLDPPTDRIANRTSIPQTPVDQRPRPDSPPPLDNQYSLSHIDNNSFKPIKAPSDRRVEKVTRINRSYDTAKARTNAKPSEATPSKTRSGNSVSGLLAWLRSGNKRKTPAPISPTTASGDFAPGHPPITTVPSSLEPIVNDIARPRTFSNAAIPSNSFEPKSFEPNSQAVNALRSSPAQPPRIDASTPSNFNSQPEVQLTSAETSVVELAPQNLFEPSLRSSKIPSLQPPEPLPHKAVVQPRHIPRPAQKNVVQAIGLDEANQPLVGRTQPSESPAPTTPHPMTYVVRDGDSYWSIAQEIYDDGRYFRALYAHNKFAAPETDLLPGTVLTTPTKSDLVRLWPDQCPREESNLAVSAGETKSDTESQTYITSKGDTPFEIARQKFGQASRFSEIIEWNRLELGEYVGPDTPLRAGLRLVLPSQ